MERAIDPLLTIDAKLWADEFMATKQRLGDAEFDHAMMLGWFANAIMQGYDEGQRRAKADAQATIAALQARVRELEQWVQDQSTANLETMRHTDEMQSRAMEAEQQLTQRTAELGAAKQHQQLHDRIFARQRDLMAHYVATIREAIRRLGNSTHSKERPEPYESRTPVIAAFLGQALGVTAEEAERERVNLQAELERVRGELVEATHNVNVYQSLYSTSCMDRALLENDLRDIRTLIAALPKVEGEIEVVGTTVRWGYGHSSCMDTRVESEAYAALLKHRHGIEGQHES